MPRSVVELTFISSAPAVTEKPSLVVTPSTEGRICSTIFLAAVPSKLNAATRSEEVLKAVGRGGNFSRNLIINGPSRITECNRGCRRGPRRLESGRFRMLEITAHELKCLLRRMRRLRADSLISEVEITRACLSAKRPFTVDDVMAASKIR